MESIAYQPAVIASPTAVNGTGASITTGEMDLLIVTDPRYAEKSQLSLFLRVTPASATKVSFGIYFSFDGGTTWYKKPVEDLTTNKGELVDVPPYLDAGSPVIGGGSDWAAVFDLPMSGANAFKITGKAAGAVSGAYLVTALCRDN